MATVRIVVTDHLRRTLVVRRTRDDGAFPSHWELPGGGIERGDASVEDAAVRELQEGTGVRCEKLVVCRSWTRAVGAPHGDGLAPEETTHYLTGEITGDVVLGSGYDRWCWASETPDGPMTPSCAWWFAHANDAVG